MFSDTTVGQISMRSGTGGSPTSLAPYGFPDLAWVLGRVLSELGIGVVDVLGLSWGGALAQQFAFQNPRRCRRLILVATGTGAIRCLLIRVCWRKWLLPEGFRIRTTPHPLPTEFIDLVGRAGDPRLKKRSLQGRTARRSAAGDVEQA